MSAPPRLTRIEEDSPWTLSDRLLDRADRMKQTGLRELARFVRGERRRRSRRLGLTMRLNTDTYIGYVAFVTGVYEPEIVHTTDALLAEYRGRPSQFLDIGANIGLMVASVAARFPRVRVVAFEPIPELADRIDQLQADNGLAFPVMRAAASDVHGTLTLHVPNDRNAGYDYGKWNPGMFTAHPGRFHSQQTVEVPATSIDDVVADGVVDADLPTVIKIDAEGHELEIIRGMHSFLTRETQRSLIVETLGETEPERAAAVWELLRGWGYRGSFIGRRFVRGCSSPTLDGNYLFERR